MRIQTAATDYFKVPSDANVVVIGFADRMTRWCEQMCYCVVIQDGTVSVGRVAVSITFRFLRPASIELYEWKWLNCPIHESNILGCCQELEMGLVKKSKLVSLTMIHTYDEPAVWLIHGGKVIGDQKLCKYQEAYASCEAIAYLIDASIQLA